MQTTAIGTVANSLPENEVILLTLLISKGYILFAELLNILRLCLRELCYIVFSCKSKKLELDFSYEYYLNIKCPINKSTLNEIVKKNNLYLDPRG